MENKRVMSTSELAKLLGISRVAIFKKIKSGQIKARKIGRNYIIEDKDVPGLAVKTTAEKKRLIENAVKKTVSEYGEVLRLLGNG